MLSAKNSKSVIMELVERYKAISSSQNGNGQDDYESDKDDAPSTSDEGRSSGATIKTVFFFFFFLLYYYFLFFLKFKIIK